MLILAPCRHFSGVLAKRSPHVQILIVSGNKSVDFGPSLRIGTVLVENLKGFMNMACTFCTQLFYQQFRCNPRFLLIFILQQLGTHKTGLLIGPESDSMHSHLFD